MSITTRAPGNEFEARTRFSYGNENTATAAFALSGPIISGRLGISVAGGSRNSDGLYRNITTGRLVNPYSEKSGRVRLDWTPTDDMGAQAAAFLSRIDDSATNYLSQSLFAGAQTSSPVFNVDHAGAPFVANILNFGTKKDDLVSLSLLTAAYPAHFGARIAAGGAGAWVANAWGDPERPMSATNMIAKAPALTTWGDCRERDAQRAVCPALELDEGKSTRKLQILIERRLA